MKPANSGQERSTREKWIQPRLLSCIEMLCGKSLSEFGPFKSDGQLSHAAGEISHGFIFF